MKKKIGLIVLSAVLLALLMAGAQALADEYAMVCDTSSLNLREGPDSSTALLGKANRGDWVQILDDCGGWYYVRLVNGGKYGYMSKKFLTTGAASALTGVVANPRSTSYLNLRENPTTASRSIGHYYNGAVCEILDVYNTSWYHVRIGSMEGYFASQYVRLETPVYPTGSVVYVATNNGGKLNMRSGPTANCGAVAKYSNGTAVNVILKGNGYWKVAVNGKIGYMDASFLSSSAPVGPVIPTGGYCIVSNSRASSYLNLRASASTSSKSLGKYYNGARLEVLMAGKEWCKVRDTASGKTGYMMTSYLRLYNTTYTRTVKNGSSYVNLRSRPSKSSGSVYAKVNSGKTVTVLVPGEDWSKVKYGSTTGYMMTRFLK